MTNAPAGRVHVWTRGDRLRAAREGMPGSPTQKEFAVLLGVARSTVVRYEGDDPGAEKPIVLIRWAEVTGYDLAWLQYGIAGPDGTPDISPDGEPVTLRMAELFALPMAA